MKLYHGTTSDFVVPDLSKGHGYKLRWRCALATCLMLSDTNSSMAMCL